MSWILLLVSAVVGIGSLGVAIFGLASDLPMLAFFLARFGAAAGLGLAAVVWGVRRGAGVEVADRWSARALLLGVSFVVALTLAELATRWIFRDITSTADNTSWFARRWASEQVELNQQGYREREFARSRPDGVYRIAVVGDSFAFGQGIAHEERFGPLLESALSREPGAPVEVLTFARPGAETDDHLRFLTEDVLPVDPDFVLLQWYTNDFHEPGDAAGGRLIPLWPHWTRRYLHESSALYFLLSHRWNQLQIGLMDGPQGESELLALLADPTNARRRRYQERLRTFIGTVTAAGAQTGVVLFPHREADTPEGYAYAPLHALVADVFAGEGQAVVDLTEAFARYRGDSAALSVNPFDAHPNARANEIAAGEIIEVMGPIWLQGRRERAESEQRESPEP